MKRKGDVSFDKRFFSKNLDNFKETSYKDRFSYIFKTNHWVGKNTVSGEGSEKSQTKAIQDNLPKIISELQIKSMLDLPCGDFNWMKDIGLDLDDYIGGDIVPEIIEKNVIKYSNSKRKFKHLDIIEGTLPMVDLIFCRDCLVHFSNDNILKSFENLKNTGSKYILTTTFTECDENIDIVTGDWRIINLTLAPFNLPEPLQIINENCTEGDGAFSDKSLGLWKISDL